MPQLRAVPGFPTALAHGVAEPRRRAGDARALGHEPWRGAGQAGAAGSGTSGGLRPLQQHRQGGSPSGFDIAVARAYAQERGLGLEFVRFRWPDLVRDLEAAASTSR